MFDEIRKVFRQSIEAFRAELGTRDPEDEVADLLMSMRRELVAARAAIPDYADEVARARAELERERAEVEQCERRAGLAERIGDTETVRIAREFADRHRERAGVLEQKLAASEAELQFRRREADEMANRYREAEANRFALLAQLRRARAGERMRAAASGDQGAFADFRRMEERIADDAAYVDALESLEERAPPDSGDRAGAADAVEERLRELKRRMGRTD